MTELDEHHLQSWRALQRAGNPVINMLDRLRTSAPAVFEHLCRTDTEAAMIAVKQGWQVRTFAEARTDADVEHARQTVAETIAGIHRDKLP
jgi:hypothetical protein